jgi:hypothetical protein
MKRPAFQFYPADWRRDAALQSCSVAARGLWIELMCVMHDCEPYGVLSVNGKAMTNSQVARLVGEQEKTIARLLAELEDAGVCSRDSEGRLFSRRMVKDEAVRNARAAGGVAGAEHGHKGAIHGKKGGRPRKTEGGSISADETPLKTPLKTPLGGFEEPPPSSSSSSSSSIHPPTPLLGVVPTDPPGFLEFWKTWPRSDRKQARGKCLEAWRKAGAERQAADVLAHVRKLAASDKWRESGGQFIPAPLTYLNQRRWEGAADDDAPEMSIVGSFV